MKKGKLIGLAVGLVMALIVTDAFAWDGCGRRGGNMRGGFHGQGGIGQEWDALTDDQKGKLKALHQKFIDETASARAAINAKREEIRILMQTSAPDSAKLHSLVAEWTNMKKQVMDKRIDMDLDAKKIAPEINLPMGFHGFGNNGCFMMDDCDVKGRGMKDGHGRMKGARGGMIDNNNASAPAPKAQ
ncbi:MAG: Spy/CpxP family protein refolding chaperone [Desulfamplus sp.]